MIGARTGTGVRTGEGEVTTHTKRQSKRGLDITTCTTHYKGRDGAVVNIWLRRHGPRQATQTKRPISAQVWNPRIGLPQSHFRMRTIRTHPGALTAGRLAAFGARVACVLAKPHVNALLGICNASMSKDLASLQAALTSRTLKHVVRFLNTLDARDQGAKVSTRCASLGFLRANLTRMPFCCLAFSQFMQYGSRSAMFYLRQADPKSIAARRYDTPPLCSWRGCVHGATLTLPCRLNGVDVWGHSFEKTYKGASTGRKLFRLLKWLKEYQSAVNAITAEVCMCVLWCCVPGHTGRLTRGLMSG